MVRLLLLAALAAAAALAGEGFPHQTHAPLKLNCVVCHTGARAADKAGLPAVAQCKVCHPAQDSLPQSRRLYRVRDFVFFSHARHAAKADCAVCHGDVNGQAAMTVVRATTMKACIDCHKEYKATLGCPACHELGQ